MLKKSISFEDLDGNKLTEDFYFNLSKAEIAEMELVQKDGLVKYLEKIVKEEDREKLIELFKGLITRSVGRRSEDGRRFIKSQEIIDEFVQSDAYSELFIELVTNANTAAEFVTGIVPAAMQDAIAEAQKDGTLALPSDTEVPPAEPATAASDAPADPTPAWVREGRVPNPDELKNATPDQIQLAFQRKEQAAQSA